MKKILTKYCPIILAFVLGFSVCAVAVPNLEPITVYLNHGLTVEFNDVDQIMTDEGGNKVIPITYNNTTYLPVRAVSNMLGVKVGWHQETQTVLLGDSYPDPVVSETYRETLTTEELVILAADEISLSCNNFTDCAFDIGDIEIKETDNSGIVQAEAFAHTIGEEHGWTETVYLDVYDGDVLWHDIGGFYLEPGTMSFYIKNGIGNYSYNDASGITGDILTEQIVNAILKTREEIVKSYKDIPYIEEGTLAYVYQSHELNNSGTAIAVTFYVYDGANYNQNFPQTYYIDLNTQEVMFVGEFGGVSPAYEEFVKNNGFSLQ